jgi:hypothetical protein
MTPTEIAEIEQIERDECEAELRARHRPKPLKFSGQPCPTGCCCVCGASPCNAGLALGLLDHERRRDDTARPATPAARSED